MLRFSASIKARRFIADVFKPAATLDNVYHSAMLAYNDEEEAERLVSILAREQQKE
jgi:hypothetical protein